MKYYIAFLFSICFSLYGFAQTLFIEGILEDTEGNVVSNYEVRAYAAENNNSFEYDTIFLTDELGFFYDTIPLSGDINEGGIIIEIESCDGPVSETQFFNLNELQLFFEMVICLDPPVDCENSFTYTQSGLDFDFSGDVANEGNVVYSWDFGDGNTAEGQNVVHSYESIGNYQVSLYTLFNNTCEFTSTQMVMASSECTNDFTFEIIDKLVRFEAFSENGPEIESYFWSFGDESSGDEKVINHQYEDYGVYEVSLVTTDIVGCTAESIYSVNVTNSNGFDLWGEVRVEEEFLDVGTVSLYIIDDDTIKPESISLVAEASIESGGFYAFTNLEEGKYLILAYADNTSFYYQNTVPTYFGNAFFWLEARIVSLGQPSNPYPIQLQTILPANAGPGKITGDLISTASDNSSNQDLISLILLNDFYEPIGVSYNTPDSEFEFNNLAYGSYYVYAEVISLPTQAGSIVLSPENPEANIAVYLSDYEVTTGLEPDIKISSKVGIYPNPVATFGYIELNAKENTTIQLKIFNELGQIIENRSEQLFQGVNLIRFETNVFPHGVYFMHIESSGSFFVRRFIK
jgi:PKD repeat protein